MRLIVETSKTEDNMVVWRLVDDRDNVVCYLGADFVEDSYDYAIGYSNLRIVTQKSRSETYWG